MPDAPTPRDREHADDGLRRAINTGDCLSEFDRDILGRSAARLHLPLRDPVDLRRLAAILRSPANDLEVSSHIRGDARHALFSARWHIKMANGRLRSNPARK